MTELEQMFLSSIKDRKDKTENGKALQKRQEETELAFLTSLSEKLSFLSKYGMKVDLKRGLQRIEVQWKDGSSTRTSVIRLQRDHTEKVGETLVTYHFCNEQKLMFETWGKEYPCSIKDIMEFLSSKAEVKHEEKKVRSARKAA